MNKTLKVICSFSLLAGIILIAKKTNASWCPIVSDTNLLSDAKGKVEHFTEKVEQAVSVADLEKEQTFLAARDAFVALLDSKESNDVPENINYVEDPENDEWTFTLGAQVEIRNGATYTVVKRAHPAVGQRPYYWLGDNGQEMELTSEEESMRGIVPFSAEYKEIIIAAYVESLKDENFELRFFGSTYGIGTRGRKSEDGSKVFAKDDIAKLKHKLEMNWTLS